MERRALLRAPGILSTEMVAEVLIGPTSGAGFEPPDVGGQLLGELRDVATGFERMRRRLPGALLVGPVAA
jgi:hypothetical protein